MFTIFVLSAAIIESLAVESVESRRSIVFGVHILTIIVPSIILAKLASPRGKTAESYIVLSVAPFMLTGEVFAITGAMFLVQTFIWAEVLGTYWQQRVV
jgi:hypothetical protein